MDSNFILKKSLLIIEHLIRPHPVLLMTTNTVTINQNESISRTFYRFAVPSVAAMVVNGLYQIIDGIFVGHFIGFQGLASINMSWPIIGIVIGTGILIGMGGGSLLSISRGKHDLTESTSILNASIVLILVFSALGALWLHFLGKPFLLLQEADGSLLNDSYDYISIFSLGTIATIGAATLPILIRNDDSPRISTILTIIGAILNIILDYLFIGIFDFGLKGAAIATILSQCVVVILSLGYFFSPYSQVNLTFIRTNLHTVNKIISIGISSLLMFTYFSFIIALHNRMLMIYGSPIHVSAFAIIGYIATLYYFISEGIASGLQPPVSYYFGANQYRKITSTVILALRIIVISGLATIAIVNLFPATVIHLFSHDNNALAIITIQGIRLHLFAIFLDGFLFIASVYFMSTDQGKKALVVSAGNLLIQLPFLYFLPQWLGVNGVWLSVPLSNIILTLFIAPMAWCDLRKRVYPNYTNN